jgi:hypothetical protein
MLRVLDRRKAIQGSLLFIGEFGLVAMVQRLSQKSHPGVFRDFEPILHMAGPASV